MATKDLAPLDKPPVGVKEVGRHSTPPPLHTCRAPPLPPTLLTALGLFGCAVCAQGSKVTQALAIATVQAKAAGELLDAWRRTLPVPVFPVGTRVCVYDPDKALGFGRRAPDAGPGGGDGSTDGTQKPKKRLRELHLPTRADGETVVRIVRSCVTPGKVCCVLAFVWGVSVRVGFFFGGGGETCNSRALFVLSSWSCLKTAPWLPTDSARAPLCGLT